MKDCSGLKVVKLAEIEKGRCLRPFLLVAGAGLEPTTFGL